MAKTQFIYTVTAFDDTAPTAPYGNLKTLCREWGVDKHYNSIARHLRLKETPYSDSKITIKKHILIKGKRKKTK